MGLMDILTNRFKRNPNEKIHSLYHGVTSGGLTVTTIVRPSVDKQRMEATKVYGPGMKRGQGGHVAVLVIGGMETTLDEMEYILQAKRAKGFTPRRKSGEIADMCRLLIERRNEQIEAARKLVAGNPSMAPKKKRTVRLHLPVGFRYVQSKEPGLKVLMRA